jgi:hypothetical protein
MYKCKVFYEKTHGRTRANFIAVTETHPEDISNEIWAAMIQNERGLKRPVIILDISWEKLEDINMTNDQINNTLEQIDKYMTHGFNAKEICAAMTKITRPELMRCIMHLAYGTLP